MSLDNIHAGESSQSIVDRIYVWKETKNHYSSFPELESEVVHDVEDNVLQSLPKRFPNTHVAVVRGDCVEAAVQLKNNHFNPLLLNMADWFIAGGCVEGGSRAQEEELFRRSNYFKSLHQKYYPLKTFTTILSSKVEFARHGINQGYKWMEKPAYIDCVAAPALQNPPLVQNRTQYKHEEHAQTMKKKIKMLFYMAFKNGNDSLVLSAWGCGAFRNPPEHVAQLFKEVLQEYDGVVKQVVFAIIPGPNFAPFEHVFSNA
jgi:uncharacterized protein (TIGR02452 family)